MDLTASELATVHFYEWERRLRGYYHCDTTVALEPYYIPFDHKEYVSEHIDDGKAPNILDRVASFLIPKKVSEEKIERVESLLGHIYEPTTELVGFLLMFPKETEIQSALFRQWLHLVSVTTTPISFEILGTGLEIRIQIISHQNEYDRIQSHLKAYFPNAIIKPLNDVFDIEIDIYSENVAIVDFGLSEEVMRPIQTTEHYHIDPLTSIVATLENLQGGDVALFQLLFQGIQTPWAMDMEYAVSDGQGGSFFSDSPEMVSLTKEKTADPLFAVCMRIAVESDTIGRTEYLATELIRNISTISKSQYNSLIPLNNDGYEYDHHLRNVFMRCSNRLGFLLNAKELAYFVHYPNKTVVSSKLGIQSGKTKILPKEALHQRYTIGINEHNEVANKVSLNDEMRLRHTHIIGATGTGKSTLIAHMMIEDMKFGNGCALFDPHGDIVEDVLLRIPEHRKDDVLLIDPYDTDFPIGFNILHANTDAEKIVLSSDIVSAFKRFATSWGDNMSSVLSQAVNTFLESSTGGTLIELKRFLLEEPFRKKFLESVDDPSIHYYWHNEYGYLKNRIAPLLTRIDTFLRPKIVRYMLAQKEGIDFRKCIDEKKIVLIKLSQGLIGEENSYLLGSLFLSKFNQVAQGRQNLTKEQRHPYYIYLDEFQNFITPSISQILSGARKYGLGLILAHQEIAQIDDYKTLNSVISNPYIRICFRLGDIDAKKLESGFSYFEQSDLQSLNVGQAIMRIGSSTNDFNIQTNNLSEIEVELATHIRTHIVKQTRGQYCKSRSTIEQLLVDLLPKSKTKNTKNETVIETKKLEKNNVTTNEVVLEKKEPIPDQKTSLEQQKDKYLESISKQEKERKHRTLQEYVRTIGLQRGFKATIEDELSNGKRIDVSLIKDDLRIAIEISVTNTVDYEVQNIQKCLDEDYGLVFMISDNSKHLLNIQKLGKTVIDKASLKKVFFFKSDELSTYLDATQKKETKLEKRVNGWRVEVNYHPNDVKNNRDSISKRILSVLKKKN